MNDVSDSKGGALRRPVGTARRGYHSQPHLLQVRWLGRIEFAEALVLQEEIVAKKRYDRSLDDQLFLLEHEPVYTIGRTPDQSSLLGAAHLPYPLFSINRGGQATYHGPGQLMGYPIIDLRRCGQDLHRYLRWLEQLLIELLAGYGIAASRRESLTERKWERHFRLPTSPERLKNWRGIKLWFYARLWKRKRSTFSE